MKKIYTLIVFLAITTLATSLLAQQPYKTFMQRVTLEVGGSYNIPLSPSKDNTSMSDYASLKNFNLGANYQISPLAGLRFTYGFNGFEDTNNSSHGITMHKLMAEGTFNIVHAIQQEYSPFEVMLHGGAGLSFGAIKQSSGTDKMGSLQIGLMPKYQIDDNFSVHLDATYVVNFKQNNFFDGGAMPSGDDTGQYLMLGLGVAYTFN